VRFGVWLARLLSLTAVLLVAAPSASAETVVTLEFGHEMEHQYQVARPLLNKYGVHATFFVNSGFVGAGSDRMTWSQLQDLYSDGNEIAGHTVDHADPATLTPDQERHEVCDDRAALLAHGFAASDFGYPYRYTALAETMARGCGYNSATVVDALRSPSCPDCPYAETIPPYQPYATRASAELAPTTSLDTLKEYVTNAENHGGGWVQLAFVHPPATLDSFLAWLAPRAAGGTVVKTVQQVIGGQLQPLPGTGMTPLPPKGSGLRSGRDSIAPVIASLVISPKRFAVDSRPTPIVARARRGTRFRYVVSEPSSMRFVIGRRRLIRRHRCHVAKRRHKARRCFRYRVVGTLRRHVPGAENTTPFSGRIGRRALRPGFYRAAVKAKDLAGNASHTKYVRFRIVRR
jgi:peptidoglycan/xylan/chitin deacetylase (PgdA/CDA1 family)